jgi:hypothetical protein
MSNQSKIPTNHVVGVISGEKSVNDAVERLHKAGYDDVLVLKHVDNLGEGGNPISALIERLSAHLSDETGYLDQYKAATEEGAVVLAVGADHGEDADKVREIMESKGAMNIRYFGKLAVSDMTPATNPSAPADAHPRSSQVTRG